MNIIDKLLEANEIVYWGDLRTGGTYDWSSNNHSTAYQSTPYYSHEGIKFDGVDDYLEIIDANDLSFGDGSDDSQFSVVAIVDMNKVAGFPVLGKGIYNTSGEWRMLVAAADSKLYFQTFDESVADCYIGRKYDTALIPNKKYVFIGTYDGSGQSSGIKIYIDGVQKDDADAENNPGTYVAMENLSANVTIGKDDTTFADGSTNMTMIINKELSATEVAQLTSEIAIVKWPTRVSTKSRLDTYINTTDPNLLAYIEFDSTSGTIQDKSDNDNDVTTTGTVTTADDYVGQAMRFSSGTSTGVIVSPSSALANVTQSGSMAVSLWVKPTRSTTNRCVITQEDGGGTGAQWLALNATGGTVSNEVATYLGGVLYSGRSASLNQWHHIVINYLQQVPPDAYGKLQIWVDGTLSLNTSVVRNINAGADGNILISNNKIGGQDYVGWLHQLLIYDRGLLQHQIEALYNKGVIHFEGCYGAHETATGATAGKLGNTPLNIWGGNLILGNGNSGNLPIKTIQATANDSRISLFHQKGGMAAEEDTAYGTWEFWFEKNAAGGEIFIPFIAENEVAVGTAGQTGYYFQATTDEKIGIHMMNGATLTPQMETAASYITVGVPYGIKITRDTVGEFTMYIRGGGYGNEYQIVLVASGANPATENTYTSGRYFLAELDSGDRLYYAGLNEKYNLLKRMNILAS